MSLGSEGGPKPWLCLLLALFFSKLAVSIHSLLQQLWNWNLTPKHKGDCLFEKLYRTPKCCKCFSVLEFKSYKSQTYFIWQMEVLGRRVSFCSFLWLLKYALLLEYFSTKIFIDIVVFLTIWILFLARSLKLYSNSQILSYYFCVDSRSTGYEFQRNL